MLYDVVVAGGGSAGVGAAVGAAQAGCRVLLLERNPYLGGQATHASLPTYCGFFTQGEPFTQTVAGVGQLVLDGLAARGFYHGPCRTMRTGTVIVVLDAEAVKVVLDECVTAAGVDVLLHTRIIGAQTAGGRVTSIECVDDAGLFTVQAQAFVDATGEANLTALAGGGVVMGDGHGHLQAATLMLRFGGVAPDADVHPVKFQAAIKQAKEAGIGPLTKELGTIVRMAGPARDVLAILADEQVYGVDAVSLTQAEISARQQAWAYLEACRRFLPGFDQAYLVQTGPAIGLRESRHIVGEYILTGGDVLTARRFDDGVARGSWPVEQHEHAGEPTVWLSIRDHSYYDIPLRALKVRNLANLWGAGRIIACDPVAFASVRVMGTCFATGHAAGVAAALSVRHGRAEPAAVRRELLRQNALL